MPYFALQDAVLDILAAEERTAPLGALGRTRATLTYRLYRVVRARFLVPQC